MKHSLKSAALNMDSIALRDPSSEMSWPCAAAAYLRGLCALLAARPY
jgi:hypothetical protein